MGTMSVNKVILIGHTGKEPEIRVTSSNLTTAAFSLATGRTFSNKQGQKVNETEWHRIKALGKLAEFCRDYLHKGALIYVEGRLSTNKWDDRDGILRSATEIIMEKITLLESKKHREGNVGMVDSNGDWTDEHQADDEIPF